MHMQNILQGGDCTIQKSGYYTTGWRHSNTN